MEIVFIIGRIILGGFFIMSGMNHFTKFDMMKNFSASKRVPMPGIAVVVTGLMLLVSGLSLLLWQFVPWGALIGIVFLVPTSIMMHNFWKIKDNPAERMTQMRYFMGNMAIVGALAILATM